MKNRSILKRLRIYMISFGVLMGFVFPVYANFFVIWKEGAFVYFFIGCIMAGITVGVVSYFFVKVILIKQLNKISVQATALKNKDISEEIQIESDDSIGLIISGLNSAVLSIRNLFSEIRKIYELADISLNKVEHTGLSTESNAVSVGAIQGAIAHVTSISKLIIDLSEQIIDSVKRGKSIVHNSAEQFNSTLEQVDNFTQIMSSLVGKSDKISEITGIIEDISAKTNLLSLNASIEAARAGVHGRSFAIVADEIRKLAASTNDSAQKIAEYIKLIQQDILEANRAVDILTKGVSKNNNNIEEVLSNFDLIENAGNDNLDENKKLAVSIDQLNNSFTDIKLLFEELSENINNLKQIITSYTY